MSNTSPKHLFTAHYDYHQWPTEIEISAFNCRELVPRRYVVSDQKWNFGYLIYPRNYDVWHKVRALPTNQEAASIDAGLCMHYSVINAAFGGVSVRQQILHLPPEEFAAWFKSIGGLHVIEGYGQGSPRIEDKHVAALQDYIPYTLKRLVATEI